MVILSHPTGNSFVRAAAGGLLDAGLLSRFHTSIACFPGNLPHRLSGLPGLSEIRRRSFDPRLEPYTTTWPFVETGRLITAKTGPAFLLAHETGPFCIDAVYRHIDKKLASVLNRASAGGVKAVYAYEDEALLSFREAKKHGIKCLYDLPIGYWRTARALLERERERWPEWAVTLTGFKDSEAKLARKDEELRLADGIFVASSFTARTLKDYPGALGPVAVVPYAFPMVQGGRIYNEQHDRPLKLLFVGGLSQRKGVADVFAAVEQLGDAVSLTVVGRKVTAECPALDQALARHTWIPSLPHNEVLALMRQHDVLLFPSLFEGFGLVITEAMAQGTPVITTDRTAGPDLITDGVNGWLVEAGSTDALRLAIEKLLADRSSVAAAGMAAMDTARGRSWEVYGRELAAAIQTFT
ncbi:glycosyltransferase family 4 protein [Hufsiella ginkgonis]|uniref:Glycosyltransferase n=1 Tax=Hufsiella ginkgonis TaxID=2695274 RepID=A0A7K1Y422_9SPHI|nr:glycosyltransferase family 4 protein [Hufsiella ginkgonis]MXV17446.1 glycosyltransferase [Hufsiella ginkgonis]